MTSSVSFGAVKNATRTTVTNMGTCREIRKWQNKVTLSFLVSHSICSNINAETAPLQWTTLSQVQKNHFCNMCYEMQYLEECWQMYSHLKWFILNNVPLNHVQVWKWRAYAFNNALLLLLWACSFQLMVPFTSFLPYLSDMGLLLPFIVFVKSSICKRISVVVVSLLVCKYHMFRKVGILFSM